MGTNWVFWVLGILAMLFGFLIFWGSFKKGKTALPNGELVHKDGVPILPRDARDINNTNDDNKTTQNSVQVVLEPSEKYAADALGGLAAAARASEEAEQVSAGAVREQSSTIQINLDDTIEPPAKQAASTLTGSIHAQTIAETKSHTGSEFRFDNPANADFESNSPVLDGYFHDIAEDDRNNEALLQHKRTLTVMISPKNSFDEISGLRILEFTKSYAMKYGIMNMFHRYENNNGTGDLWFSMLGAGHDGVRPFDLNELPTARFRSLALFVSLPHPNALKAFNSMTSVAQMIAKELDADLHDEEGYLLTAADLQAMQNTLDD